MNKILSVLHKKRQQKKCPIVNQVVQLYVQMILLPDLIRLIVFSVIRKVIKKGHKFHKIESQDRMKKKLDAARRNSDYEIESKVLHEQLYDKALYHNGCICKYFMKTPQRNS